MEMTFTQYINNPMGTANAVMSNRTMYANLYKEKFNKVMVRENGKISYKTYRGKSKFYIHLKIPSETIKSFYYDIVLEFTPPKDKKITPSSLKDYNVRFYSNDPAFVFTFAHAFIHHGLFINDLKDKMSNEAIKEKAKIKNPSNQIGYVKTLYFAYLYMSERNLFNKLKYVEKYNESVMKSNIEDANDKINQRMKGGEIIKSRHKRDIEKLKDINKKRGIMQDAAFKAALITNKVRDTKVSKMVKSSGTIKKTKTTKKR